jgi:hypothetical protein
VIAGAAVCGITSGTAAAGGGAAGLRGTSLAAGLAAALAAGFLAGRALRGAFFFAFALADRRAGLRAAARLLPPERFRPRVLFRAFFELIFRFAIRHPSDRPLPSGPDVSLALCHKACAAFRD